MQPPLARLGTSRPTTRRRAILCLRFPEGIWSYGQTPYGPDTGSGPVPDASQFILYDENGFDPSGTIQVWQDGPSPSVDTLGGVSTNTTGAFHANFGIDWEPLEIDLMPDQGGLVVSTARLQVPSDGVYSVHAEFADNQNVSVVRDGDAWVFTDNVFQPSPLFYTPQLPASDGFLTHGTGTVRNFGGPVGMESDCGPTNCYDGLLNLDAGDSIYFASGKGPVGGDHVLLRAVVECLACDDPPPDPTDFSWKFDKSDTWDSAANWNPGVSPGDTSGSNPSTPEDQTAIFGDVITEPQLVYTHADKTLNGVRFDNANSYAIAGHATITLASGSGGTIAPTLSATQGTHQFQLNVALDADTTADITTGATVEFNNRLNLNGNTLTVTGGGYLSINNALNSGGGSVNLTAGVVSGSGVISGDLTNGDLVAPGTGAMAGANAVPEPTAMVLLLTSVMGIVAWGRKRRS